MSESRLRKSNDERISKIISKQKSIKKQALNKLENEKLVINRWARFFIFKLLLLFLLSVKQDRRKQEQIRRR